MHRWLLYRMVVNQVLPYIRCNYVKTNMKISMQLYGYLAMAAKIVMIVVDG